MARYDDLDTKTIAMVAIISSIVLLIIILAGRAASYAWEGAYEEYKAKTAKYSVSDEKIAAQKAALTKKEKVEVPPLEEGQEATTRLVVPIDQALELVKDELTAKPET